MARKKEDSAVLERKSVLRRRAISGQSVHSMSSTPAMLPEAQTMSSRLHHLVPKARQSQAQWGRGLAS